MDFGNTRKYGSFRKRKSWATNSKRVRDIKADLDPRLLWILWFAGISCVLISIFATHSTSFLPSLEEHVESMAQFGGPQEEMRVTIFTAPVPFEGDVGMRQAMAIDSWLRLDPKLDVVLFAQHRTAHAFASARGNLVSVDSAIDFTFLGKPLFHGMVQRALSSSSDIVMIANPQVILLKHTFLALRSLHGIKQDWLLAAVPLSVTGKIFPFSLQGEQFQSFGAAVDDEEVENYVRHNGVSDACNSAELWAWNGNKKPLHAGVMPPFVYGAGHHNQWLLSEAVASNYRVVLDGSKALNIFQTQDANNREDSSSILSVQTTESNRVSEISDNAWLASTYGSYYFRPLTSFDVLIKLEKCRGSLLNLFCLVNMSQHPCSCTLMTSLAGSENWSLQQKGSLAFVPHRPTWMSWFGERVGWIVQEPSANRVDASMGSEKSDFICGCNEVPSHQRGNCMDSQLLPGSAIVKSSLSYSLKRLLSQVANDDNVVILAVVGNSYRDLLMSWVCRLKQLRISNFLVSALDDDIHHFAILQGLPVFRTSLDMNVSRDECHFGTECFQKVTKMKSHTVLQILQLGFHVLFSDVDVYWFEDPTKELSSFGPGHLPAQSDQWNESEPLNEPRRLNSGFYFARSDQYIIAAFQKIIKHAASSDMSEQPSFYDTLCGEDTEFRVGNDICREPELNVTVTFLDPVSYPNGAFRALWDEQNVRAACIKQGCKVLHNNWVPSRKRKLDRQISAGLWDYDASTRMCLTSKEHPRITSSSTAHSTQ